MIGEVRCTECERVCEIHMPCLQCEMKKMPQSRKGRLWDAFKDYTIHFLLNFPLLMSIFFINDFKIQLLCICFFYFGQGFDFIKKKLYQLIYKS